MSRADQLQDLDAERSVLGGLMLMPSALADVADLLRAEDFAHEPHRLVWESILALDAGRQPLDVVTLMDAMRSAGTLERVGGAALVSSLDAFVPATSNLVRYARIVRERSQRRALIVAADRVREAATDAPDVTEAAERAQAAVMEAVESRAESRDRTVGEGLRELWPQLESRYNHQGDVTGLASGLVDLDVSTAGWQPGDLVILAGRPGMGKTAASLGFAAHAAVELGKPVAIFSLEMSTASLTQRLLSMRSGVPHDRFRTGRFLDIDWPRLRDAAARIAAAPMRIDDAPAPTVTDLRARARRLKQRMGGLALIVVDYLQLLRVSGKHGSREEAVAEMSRGLKALARELDVPVLALAQLNRTLEGRKDRRPILSDLRESGALEQDADVVLFVYREEMHDKTAPKGTAEVIVAKQRNGPTGTVECAFDGTLMRFQNRSWRDQ